MGPGRRRLVVAAGCIGGVAIGLQANQSAGSRKMVVVVLCFVVLRLPPSQASHLQGTDGETTAQLSPHSGCSLKPIDKQSVNPAVITTFQVLFGGYVSEVQTVGQNTYNKAGTVAMQ